jgi:fluoride exporter
MPPGLRDRVRRRLPLPWRRRLAVLVGGVAGGAGRIGLHNVFDSGGGVPWGTFVANVTGAFLLGYLLTRFLQAGSRSTLTIPLVGIGALGSFTTFSTFTVEVWDLLDRGEPVLAGAYAAASVALGLVAAAVGMRWAERR